MMLLLTTEGAGTAAAADEDDDDDDTDDGDATDPIDGRVSVVAVLRSICTSASWMELRP